MKVACVGSNGESIDAIPAGPSTPPRTPSATAWPPSPSYPATTSPRLLNVIDGLVAKNLLKTLAGGLG